MYLDHHMLLRISRIMDIAGDGALLMDDQGNVLYPAGDARRLTLPESVLGTVSKPVVYGGVTLIGLKPESSQFDMTTLYICIGGDSRDVQKCAIMCAELVRLTIESHLEGPDVKRAFRKLLRGECNVSEMEAISRDFSVPMSQERCVMCIYLRGNPGDKLAAALNGFDEGGNFWVDLNQNMPICVKALPDESGYAELRKEAEAIYEKLQSAGIDAVIGVSEPKLDIGELADAVNEAKEAINVGGLYLPNESILVYRRLMLERFLYNVPVSAGKKYGVKVFNPATARLFTDEMINTIEVFFKANLNLSEAARTLGIHRNTLVYRLEKVQKLTGFDLREFDDAMTFKMVMLLNKNAHAAKPRI